MQAQESNRYVSDQWLAIYFGVSRSTIWRWARRGLLPAPVSLSPGTTRWRLTDVLACIETSQYDV